MPMPLDLRRQHDWRRMQITRLRLYGGELWNDLNHPQPEVRVGCFTCNMSFEEGKDVNCPGRPLEDMFDEDGTDPLS